MFVKTEKVWKHRHSEREIYLGRTSRSIYLAGLPVHTTSNTHASKIVWSYHRRRRRHYKHLALALQVRRVTYLRIPWARLGTLIAIQILTIEVDRESIDCTRIRADQSSVGLGNLHRQPSDCICEGMGTSDALLSKDQMGGRPVQGNSFVRRRDLSMPSVDLRSDGRRR